MNTSMALYPSRHTVRAMRHQYQHLTLVLILDLLNSFVASSALHLKTFFYEFDKFNNRSAQV